MIHFYLGGNEVEILIVNDGSLEDRTGEVADEYEKKYPGICRAIHQENGGHGAVINIGLQEKGWWVTEPLFL